MKQNRKKYDTAFKLEAIRLATEGDRNISEVERNLGIGTGTCAGRAFRAPGRAVARRVGQAVR